MFPSLRSMETQDSFCVPRVCAPKKHREEQCVRNIVSSFARAYREFKKWPWQQERHKSVIWLKQKFGFIKRIDKGWITTVKDLESWRFER